MSRHLSTGSRLGLVARTRTISNFHATVLQLAHTIGGFNQRTAFAKCLRGDDANRNQCRYTPSPHLHDAATDRYYKRASPNGRHGKNPSITCALPQFAIKPVMALSKMPAASGVMSDLSHSKKTMNGPGAQTTCRGGGGGGGGGGGLTVAAGVEAAAAVLSLAKVTPGQARQNAVRAEIIFIISTLNIDQADIGCREETIFERRIDVAGDRFCGHQQDPDARRPCPDHRGTNRSGSANNWTP